MLCPSRHCHSCKKDISNQLSPEAVCSGGKEMTSENSLVEWRGDGNGISGWFSSAMASRHGSGLHSTPAD